MKNSCNINLFNAHIPCNDFHFNREKKKFRENYVPHVLLEHYDSGHDNIAAMTK